MIAWLAACGRAPVVLDALPPTVAGQEPTWWQDIRPIVRPSCTGCHAEGGVAERLSLVDYADARPLSVLMADRTARRTMPPFHASASPDCTPRFPWVDDPRLDDAQVGLIGAWAEAGAPAGDAGTAAAAAEPTLRSLTDWDVELFPPKAVFPSTGDSHLCFPLLLPNEATTWIEASEVLPGDPSVVHHVQVRLDTTGGAMALANDEGWYECYGAVDGEDLGGFLPGAPPMELPDGAGIEAPPGAVVVLQIHYFNADGSSHPDATSVRLRTVDVAPQYEPEFLRVGNDVGPTAFGGLQPGDTGDLDFVIPAGATHHVEQFEYRVTDERTRAVYIVANHMHQVGVSARLWVERGTVVGDEPVIDCLLDTDDWDPAWQQTFQYDLDTQQAPLVRNGDTLWVECTFDNSLANARVVDLLAAEGLQEPVDVSMGPTVLDEMCVSLVGMIDVSHDTRWPGELPPPVTETAETGDTGPDTAPPPDTSPPPDDTAPPEDTAPPVDTAPPPPPCEGTRLVLSEVVDHVQWGALKYVEIANAGDTDASLSGLQLAAWTNGAGEAQAIALPDVLLPPGGAFVVVAPGGEAEYEFLTGLTADLTSDVADGNGDDAYALLDGAGVLDAYGEAGVDGTGAAWEYTDASAVRNPAGSCATTNWTATDWTITQGFTTASPGALNPEPSIAWETIKDVQKGVFPEGTEVDLTEVMVIGVTEDGAFVQERAGTSYTGVFAWLGPHWEAQYGPLEAGDLLDLTALVVEWEGQTEVDPAAAWHGALSVTGSAALALPDDLTLADLLADPEPWEGVYVSVSDVTCVAAADDDGTFEVGDDVYSILVGDAVWAPDPAPAVNDAFALVAGPLAYVDGQWVIQPTGPADLVAR